MTLEECKTIIARKHHWDEWSQLRNTGIDEDILNLISTAYQALSELESKKLCHEDVNGYLVWRCATACAGLPNCAFNAKKCYEGQ